MYPLPSLGELHRLAKELIAEYSTASVWAFEGEMGVGKTTLIQAILSELGIGNLEGSPTYSIVNEYTSPQSLEVYHFDLYRLNSLREALDIGMDDILNGRGLSLVEWPAVAKDLFPDETIWFKLSILEDNQSRILTVQA